MNVKGGTQTWSKAEQVSSLKPDSARTLSPQDMETALGGSDLGEVLNKVADPNWVDPAKTRKVGNNTLDKDAFFKLMLTQMKYQDPTNPMQSHEMAAQLAQFTSLEQLNNINSGIEGLRNQQAPSGNFQALNFIGKKVSGDSSKIARTAGDKYHDVGFELGGDASEVKMTIRDGDGNVVKQVTAKNLKKGSNAISWNGLAEDGSAARAGEYRVTFEAKAPNGMKVATRTEFEGRITGLNFTPQGPILMVGNQSVRMQDVKKISEVSPEEMMLERAPVTPLEAKGAGPNAASGGAKAKRQEVPGAPEAPSGPKIMENVAMSRGMMDKLQAETAPATSAASSSGDAQSASTPTGEAG